MRNKLRISLGLLLLPVWLWGAALPGVRSGLVNRRPYLHLGDLARYHRLAVKGAGRDAVLQSGRTRVKFSLQKRQIVFNGIKVNQNFAPAWTGGGFYISRSDWNETLRPLLFPGTLPRKRVKTVFIDCGHGGKDKGASGRFSSEKNITLKLGFRLAAILRAKGYRVCFSRTSDRQIALQSRAVIANRSGGDVFISLHVNSAGNRTITGIETFCLTPYGAPSAGSSKAKYVRYAGNRNDAANLALAYQVQKSLLARTGAVDRGVKRARFAVLRDAAMPAVLVEVGFISNRGEEQRLNTPAYIEKIAAGIADGITAYQRQVTPYRKK